MSDDLTNLLAQLGGQDTGGQLVPTTPPVADAEVPDIRKTELERFDRIADAIQSNYYKDREEQQTIINHLFKAVEGGKFDRVHMESLVQCLGIKANSTDILGKLLDSRSKLLAVLKSVTPSQVNINTAGIAVEDQEHVRSLLNAPLAEDER